MTHLHSWSRDTRRDRFTCTVPGCKVVGHAPSILSGQHRGASFGVTPYKCAYRAVKGDKRCGAEAVHVECDRQRNRCAEHENTLTRQDGEIGSRSPTCIGPRNNRNAECAAAAPQTSVAHPGSNPGPDTKQ